MVPSTSLTTWVGWGELGGVVLVTQQQQQQQQHGQDSRACNDAVSGWVST
jgi:hypothetical protein